MDQEAYNQVEALLRLFREHRLAGLAIEDGIFKLRLGRGEKKSNPLPRAAAAARPAAAPGTRRAGKGRTVAVRSPLIGVFYRSPAPDADAFVEVGDVVSEGQTVCIVEAMKVFNEIPAEMSGKIVAVLARNGESVEYGQPLFRVDTSG